MKKLSLLVLLTSLTIPHIFAQHMRELPKLESADKATLDSLNSSCNIYDIIEQSYLQINPTIEREPADGITDNPFDLFPRDSVLNLLNINEKSDTILLIEISARADSRNLYFKTKDEIIEIEYKSKWDLNFEKKYNRNLDLKNVERLLGIKQDGDNGTQLNLKSWKKPKFEFLRQEWDSFIPYFDYAYPEATKHCDIENVTFESLSVIRIILKDGKIINLEKKILDYIGWIDVVLEAHSYGLQSYSDWKKEHGFE